MDILLGPHTKCDACGTLFSFSIKTGDTLGTCSTLCQTTNIEYYWECPTCGHKNGPNKFLGFISPAVTLPIKDYNWVMKKIKSIGVDE